MPSRRLPLWIHLVNRYISAVRRNMPRAIHRQVLTFPPIASNGRSPFLVVLCEADKFFDGCWAAWSWMRHVRSDLRLQLFVDGALAAEQQQQFAKLFPGGVLSSLPDFLSSFPAKSHSFAELLAGYRYARKLALILHLQRSNSFLYCDSDVLTFREPSALLERIRGGSGNAFMHDSGEPCVDPWLVEKARQHGLPIFEQLNSGLLWIEQQSLDVATVDLLLEGWDLGHYNHFCEQTLIAVLMACCASEALPVQDYVLSNRGMFFWECDIPCEQMTVRHYVGPVRHRMYEKAYPFLARQAADESAT